MKKKKTLNKIIHHVLKYLKFIVKLFAYIILELCYKWKWLVSFLYIVLCFILNSTIFQHEIVYKFLNHDYIKTITFNQFYKNIYVPIYFLEIVGLILLILWLRNNFKLKDYKQKQIKGVKGLKNANGDHPYLMKIKRAWINLRMTIMILNANSINIDKWREDETKADLETALNKIIVEIEPYKNTKNKIKITTISPNNKIPKKIDWNDKNLDCDSPIYYLGENLFKKITRNINDTPHYLVAGSTGSGKSVLLDLLIYQSLHKGYIVRVCDPKQTEFVGWDKLTIKEFDYFGKSLEDKQCQVSTSLDKALEDLRKIDIELAAREVEFKNARCRDIDKYNKIMSKKWQEVDGKKYTPLSRIIYVFDEFVEISNKKYKDIAEDIIDILTTIATRGRSLGIHLILSAQRPDHKLIEGQIKSNLDNRICGRTSDKPSSEVVLGKGNYEGNTLINNGEKGLFVTNNGELFRGYYLDQEKVTEKLHKQKAIDGEQNL